MKKIVFLMLGCSLLFAQVTLCYKENWKQLSQIEVVALDGGQCAGKYSVKDMQQKGWIIKDIQISKSQNGFNYSYVLQKQTTQTMQPLSKTPMTKQDIKATILEVKKDEEKQKQIIQQAQEIKSGEKIYKAKCASCHGDKGEVEAYGLSKKLKDMSLDEMKTAIRDYEIKEKDNGMAILMEPYLIVENDIEKVYKYLQEVNK
jgi:mono/diheme cytochrome c family protein